MNRILVTLFAAIAATAVSAAPAGNRFRIDMQGEKGLGLVYKSGSEGTSGSQAGWLKEKKDTRLIVTGPISQEWKIAIGVFVTAAKLADRADRWWPMGKPGFAKEAQGGSGKKFVTCAHNDRWLQTFSCKAGEAVTVTFLAKLAEAPKAAK